MPSQIFREYDIRGVADRDLTDDLARAVGRGLGTILGGGRIVVGRDCRVSSDRLFAALSDGLVRAGANVLEIGVGPAPFLYGSVHALDADGGVMITGSHNPPEFNGFKLCVGAGTLYGEKIQDVRRIIETGDFRI